MIITTLSRPLLVGALLLGASPLLSQEVDTMPALDSAVTADTSTLVIGPVMRPAGEPILIGRDTILHIFGSLGAETVDERAKAIAARFDRLLQRATPGIDSMRISERDNQMLIVLGEEPLMEVLQADADGAGVSRPVLAVEYLTALDQAFESATVWRDRTPWMAVGLALLATVIALSLGWLLRQLVIRLQRLVGLLRASKRLPSFRIQNLEIISADRIADAGQAALGIARIIAWGVLGYFYLVLVLSLFPWTRPLSGRILGYLTYPVGVVGDSVLAYLPNLFFIAVIVIVTRLILKLIRFLFDAVRLGRLEFPGFERDWAEPTYKLVRFLALAFALVVLFPYLPGSKSDAFRGVSLFMGLLLSLGSTGAVANVVSGTLLTYTRSFQVGDRVQIDDTIGDVVARTLLVTRIRTPTNVEVAIPNSKVMSGHVLNYTTHAEASGIALQATVTIGYDVPWRQVHDLLTAAAAATEGIAESPKSFVLQTGLEDNYPSYELNAYTHDPAAMRHTLSALHAAIQDRFAEAKVEITSPTYLATRDGSTPAIPESAG